LARIGGIQGINNEGGKAMDLQAFMELLIWEYMWGLPMVATILAIGVYFSARTGFFQITFFGTAMKAACRKIFGLDKEEGDTGVISPLEATSIAIGTTVGVGNIGGVAAAVALGGPGAVFWMWVAGLFGMLIKMVEITLAVYYRSKLPNGEAYGGPNYYMKKGIGVEMKLGGLAKALSALFAFGFLTGFVLNIQTYTVSEAVATTFGIGMMPVGIFFTVMLYVMIVGGLPGLGRIANKLVPFMCVFYLAAGLFIIFRNIEALPSSLALVFGSAFTGTAAFGGFAGAAFQLAIKTGMARSVFSNEAGWGSAPMIHASARVNHPVKQGLMGIFEVFVDTFIICSITCLVIMVTGQWSSGASGAELTLLAFETGIGSAGRIILAFSVFIFGITTSSGLYAQMEVVMRYLVGERRLKRLILTAYKWIYPLPGLGLVMLAVYLEYPGTTIWLFSDASTATPIFVNILALALLSPKFLTLLKDYKARYLGIGEVDKNAKVFYEE